MSIWGQLTSFWNENHALIMQTATTYWNMFKGMIENVMNAISSSSNWIEFANYTVLDKLANDYHCYFNSH